MGRATLSSTFVARHRFRCAAGILVMLIAVECPSLLWAYRPFVTEDADVLHPLQFAAEIGHDYKETGDGDRSFAGNYTASSGLIRNTELDLTVPVIYHFETEKNGDGGAGDLDLRTQVSLIQEKKWSPAFTFAGSVIFPTGDANRNLGSPKTNYRALAVWTKTAGPLTAHANAGWDFINDARDMLVLSGALDLRVSRRWHLTGEWDGLTDFKSTTQDEKWGLAGGLILEASSRLWWDAALRFGTNSEDDDYTLTTGLTLSF